MHFLDLPDELLCICCSLIDGLPQEHDEDAQENFAQINTRTLRNLRLTCKRILSIASKQLFSRIHPLPTSNSAQHVRAILNSHRLRPLVNVISLQASLDIERRYDGDEPKPAWRCHDVDFQGGNGVGDDDAHSIDTDDELSGTFKQLLDDVGLFSNLRRIELSFDWEVEGPTGNPLYWANEDMGIDVKETLEYRDTFFSKLLSALNHPDHPATKLNSLSITNLQDWVSDRIAESEDFKVVLSRLENLEFCITSQCESAAPEHEIEIYARHEFYPNQLRKYWLEPMQESGRLSSLKLYGSIPWGYLPKCDLRGLHFPKLRTLSLENMHFTHDWQLDWILSHKDSLESLSLHNCPIIPNAELECKVDAEYYPIPKVRTGTGRGRARIQSTWSYQARWHHYFNSFRTELYRLRHFAITKGHMSPAYGHPHAGQATYISRAFAAAETWPTELRVGRYDEGPMTHWGLRYSDEDEGEARFRANINNHYSGYHMNHPRAYEPSYPNCWDEDEQALNDLLAAIQQR